MKKIFAHTIVNNEENFIWFAIKSVIGFVDKVLVWDTGSDDKTVEIINGLRRLYPKKIVFREVGKVDRESLSMMRQKMLDESDCDWIMILDGDEVWNEQSIGEVAGIINSKGDELDGIVVPFYNLVGDVFHFQSEDAGRYRFGDKTGHLQIKAINRRIPGLHVKKAYPLEGFYDNDERPLQESKKLSFAENKYLHMTHLKRSSKRRRFEKSKLEIGEHFPPNFKFPEVFYEDYPDGIRDPFSKIDGAQFYLAKLLTILRKVKRKANGFKI